MESLNQIEKQLENRSVKELQEIVDTFITSLDKLSNKYPIGNFAFEIADKNYSQGTTCLNPRDVRHHLLYMLKDAYLQSMVREKSKELLTKLDLIS